MIINRTGGVLLVSACVLALAAPADSAIVRTKYNLIFQEGSNILQGPVGAEVDTGVPYTGSQSKTVSNGSPLDSSLLGLALNWFSGLVDQQIPFLQFGTNTSDSGKSIFDYLPTDAFIWSAALHLKATRSNNWGFRANAAIAAWNETTLTWGNKPMAADPNNSIEGLSHNAGDLHIVDVTQEVVPWRVYHQSGGSAGKPNYGFMVDNWNSSIAGTNAWYSSHAGAVADRPKLTITYEKLSYAAQVDGKWKRIRNVPIQNALYGTGHAWISSWFARPGTWGEGAASAGLILGNNRSGSGPWGTEVGRAILKIDLTGIGGTLVAAELQLHGTEACTFGGTVGTQWDVYGLKRGDWVAGETTWSNANATTLWNVAGAIGAGDSDSALAGWGGTTAPGYAYFFDPIDITQLVSNWVSGARSNHGLLLNVRHGSTANPNSVNNTANNAWLAGGRPLLVVTLLFPPGTVIEVR